jgi:hypothetical protein
MVKSWIQVRGSRRGENNGEGVTDEEIVGLMIRCKLQFYRPGGS